LCGRASLGRPRSGRTEPEPGQTLLAAALAADAAGALPTGDQFLGCLQPSSRQQLGALGTEYRDPNSRRAARRRFTPDRPPSPTATSGPAPRRRPHGPDAPRETADSDRGLRMRAQVVVPGRILALPSMEATTTRLSPPGTPITGEVRCWPVLAPVVSMTTGSPESQLENVCLPRVSR
jgi:hypothetical protein